MALRKLIKFGKSSYVISLPTEWIKRNKLNKGDEILLDEREGELKILPSVDQEKKKTIRGIEINIDKKDSEAIIREIISAYISNYDKIILKGDSIKDKAKEIRDILHNLMAVEIIDQTADRIVARNFLNIRDISIPGLVRRMDIMTRAMIEDSKLTLERDRYFNLLHRDEDINRLSYLLFRVVRASLKDIEVSRILNLTDIEALNTWWMVVNLEKISDHTKRIARYLRQISLNEKGKKEIYEIYEKIEKHYLEVMKAYYDKNYKLAYEIATSKAGLVEECRALRDKYWNHKYVPDTIHQFLDMNAAIHEIGRVVYTDAQVPLKNS